jgi:hypothetical protein
MKRKALLNITDCTAKKFETYAFRDHSPFQIEDGNWSDYQIEDAFALKVLMDAADSTDLSSASLLARLALGALHPIDPFAYCEQELWIALVRYDWPDAPEGWDCRHVVAGRWADVELAANTWLLQRAPSARITGILTISATKIANTLLKEARDLGIPEGLVHGVPENLSGYPEWYKVGEMTRRALLFQKAGGES